jgi:S-ribosylhomocysteine lyase LuxS involved in autoinducer biosynthesis
MLNHNHVYITSKLNQKSKNKLTELDLRIHEPFQQKWNPQTIHYLNIENVNT